MNTAIEDRIRTRAYAIWEGEGRPEGREIEHWLQAVREVAEDRVTIGAVASRPRRTRAAAATAAPAPARSRSRSSKSA